MTFNSHILNNLGSDTIITKTIETIIGNASGYKLRWKIVLVKHIGHTTESRAAWRSIIQLNDISEVLSRKEIQTPIYLFMALNLISAINFGA